MQKYGQDFLIRKVILDDKTQKYLNNFDSGNPDIDDYFKREASDDTSSVTYMYIDTDSESVIALATVSCSSISVLNNNNDLLKSVPAIEIKYFALDEHFQHIPYVKNSPNKLSHYVLCTLVDNLKMVSTRYVGAVKIVLQAMPDKVSFYSKCKFKELKPFISENVISEDDGCVPMFYDLNESPED